MAQVLLRDDSSTKLYSLIGNNMNKKHSTSGFTLIEILVSVALLGIMSGIGISLYAIINGAVVKANTINRLQSEGSAVFERLERSVRSAIVVENTNCKEANDACLHLTIPTDSIEYNSNGGCQLVDYYYNKPDGGNGKLWVQSYRNDGTSCGDKHELFTSDGPGSISVEAISGTPMFDVVESKVSPDHVTVSLNLFDGWSADAQQRAKRIKVPFITSISLRSYTR